MHGLVSLKDVEIFSNVVHDCHGAGLVLSAENGKSVDKVDIHNNLIFNNDGSGFLFSRWGVDHLRSNIRIANNIFLSQRLWHSERRPDLITGSQAACILFNEPAKYCDRKEHF